MTQLFINLLCAVGIIFLSLVGTIMLYFIHAILITMVSNYKTSKMVTKHIKQILKSKND